MGHYSGVFFGFKTPVSLFPRPILLSVSASQVLFFPSVFFYFSLHCLSFCFSGGVKCKAETGDGHRVCVRVPGPQREGPFRAEDKLAVCEPHLDPGSESKSERKSRSSIKTLSV